jgi:hypothetical protein
MVGFSSYPMKLIAMHTVQIVSSFVRVKYIVEYIGEQKKEREKRESGKK